MTKPTPMILRELALSNGLLHLSIQKGLPWVVIKRQLTSLAQSCDEALQLDLPDDFMFQQGTIMGPAVAELLATLGPYGSSIPNDISELGEA